MKLAAACLCLALSLPLHSYAQNKSRDVASTLRGLSTAFQALMEQTRPAIVQVRTVGLAPSQRGSNLRIEANRGVGSGVIVDPAGYIVTNAHVIGAARRVQVLLPEPGARRTENRSILKPLGKQVPAEVLGLDRETDVAVLKVAESGLPHLPFGDSETLKNGNIVFAAGSPLGLENSVSMGVISSVARQIQPDDPMIYVQTDASINPGSSGGPLIDADGAIVGINTFILSQSGGSEGVGFAIPSNIVRSVYEQIMKHGRVRRGQIGLLVQTITPELARALDLSHSSGVIVSDVVPGGPAEAAGLEIRDLILMMNGKPMENARQFGVNVYQKANETVTLEMLRGSEKITKQVAILERPKDPERILSIIRSDENTVDKLGILAVDLSEKVSPLLPPLRRLSGVVVAAIVRDVSGADDTLRTGDVIYAINNTPVRSLAELQKTLSEVKPASTIAVQVEREGQLQFLTLDID